MSKVEESGASFGSLPDGFVRRFNMVYDAESRIADRVETALALGDFEKAAELLMFKTGVRCKPIVLKLFSDVDPVGGDGR